MIDEVPGESPDRPAAAEFVALPGRSSGWLSTAGVIVSSVSTVGLSGLFFAGRTGSAEGVYIAGVLVLIVVWFGVGVAIQRYAARKVQREIANGYTCRIDVAIRHPELFLVDYRTLAVRSGPFEQRPALLGAPVLRDGQSQL